MENLWNQLTLKHPPTTTWDSTSNDFPAKSFFKLLHKIYDEIASQDILNTEATLLSRLIYRMKRKFRHDKGFKSVEKINRALLNYLTISLQNEYKYLIDNTIINEQASKLPTKQMLQYVLTRTQGLCVLLCRIEKVSIEAAQYFKIRLQLGHAWSISILIYAVISRIWIWSRHIIERCCVWYNQMFPFLSQLNQIGVNWLSENYELPSDLKNWLPISWINKPFQSSIKNENSVDSIFNLIKYQNASDNGTDSTEEIEKNKNEILIDTIINKEVIEIDNDIGVPVSRSSLSFNLTKPLKTSKAPKKIIAQITSTDDLNELLALDSYPGLDKLQWRIIKKIFNKNLLKIRKNTDPKKHNVTLKKMNKILQAYSDR